MEEKCVLVNHNNSKSRWDRRNASRRLAHHQQALDRNEARNDLEEIELALEREAEACKASNELTKELREKKKAIQATSGVKKTKRPGEKEKMRLPDEEEIAGSKNNTPKDPLLVEG